MSTIRKDIDVPAHPDAAWDAVRDFGRLHDRLVPGFVTDTRLDGDDRIVVFAAGVEARERLVARDDERRRLVYAVVDSPLGAAHQQAAVEVLDDPTTGGSRIVWTMDLLPDDLAPFVEGMMDEGAAAIARALSTRTP